MSISLLSSDSDSVIAEKLQYLGKGKVLYEPCYRPGISLVSIENPDHHNALSGKMMAELYRIVGHLEKDTNDNRVGVIVTGGPNKAFCAGLDLDFAGQYLKTPESISAMNKFMYGILARFSRLPLIAVGSVAGPAVGGGTELIAAMDFICMGDTAYLSFVQVRNGLPSPWGGARRLIERIGRKNTLRILGTAAKVHATDALQIGLVDVIVTDSDYSLVLESSVQFIQHFIDANGIKRMPWAVRSMKALVVQNEIQDTEAELMLIQSTLKRSNL
ncbi:ClpP/crotonase-like domain-containing protein [Phycomyces blakesleeanus]|uniref:ClpP/crotonase-like domain-containing protein n=1 Tax=Phycomyces blakesleeanus TaxID=4837 RepID=A0ABR3B221_PHYBL